MLYRNFSQWKLHQYSVNTHLEFNNCLQEFYSCRQMYLNQFSERLKGGSRKSKIPNSCSLNLQCTTQPWCFLTSLCFFYCKLYHDILSYFSLFSPPPVFLPPPLSANLPLYSPMQFTVVIFVISVKQQTSRTELILNCQCI